MGYRLIKAHHSPNRKYRFRDFSGGKPTLDNGIRDFLLMVKTVPIIPATCHGSELVIFLSILC
jgi:hypothetical protein